MKFMQDRRNAKKSSKNLRRQDYLLEQKYDMTIEQRLHSLFRIRKIILDMVDGDILRFGSEKNRDENLAWAVRMWLSYGKNRARFYDRMREQVYLEKQKKSGEGYWKLVRSFENDYKTSAADDVYLQSWSGGSGSYIFCCDII